MSDMTEKLFKKFRKRLEKDAWIKSLLFGFIVGFFALFITAFVFWIVNPNLFWVSFLVWLGVTVLATPIVYLIKYRPTDKDVARAMDDLGLQERMITMLQYESDDSFMATKQREDAQLSISTVSAKMIGFALTLPMIIMIAVSFVMGGGMTTVTYLSAKGILPSGNAIIEEITPEDPEVFVSVSYLVEGAGYIEGGEPEQLVLHADCEGDLERKATETVTAVPEDGWMFICWSDGLMAPTRYDKNLVEDLEVFALLMELPPMDGQGPGQGGEGEPGEGDGTGENGKNDQNTEDPGLQGGASGKYEPSNQIIDGKIYYRESPVYQECYAEALRILENQGVLENGEELPPELRAVLDAYFKVIK